MRTNRQPVTNKKRYAQFLMGITQALTLFQPRPYINPAHGFLLDQQNLRQDYKNISDDLQTTITKNAKQIYG